MGVRFIYVIHHKKSSVSSSCSVTENMNMLHIYCAYFFSILAVIYAGEQEKSGCLEREKSLAQLEIAENLLSKAGDGFPSCKENLNSTNSTDCKDEKPLAYIEISKKLISDVRKNFPECPNRSEKENITTPKPIEKDDRTTPNPNMKEDITTPQPIDKDDKVVEYGNSTDCSEILASGRNESGVYTVYPSETKNQGKPLQVYCDMDTDNGGWTVIQRRGEFPVQEDFEQDWESYKNGFGSLTEEFWLGNENIRILCHKGCKIRFDLQDSKGEKGFAVYQNFRLTDKMDKKYILAISGYDGTVGDSMKLYDANMFSTKDYGRTGQAVYFKSGWWHRDTGYNCNLNGIYKDVKADVEGVFWYTWHNNREALKSVEIKVIPKKN